MVIIDRRLSPRYKVDFSVDLTIIPHSEAEPLTAQAVELSLSGIRLRCTRPVEQRLVTQSAYVPVWWIHFKPPGYAERITVHARLTTQCRVDREHYHLGFHFIESSAKNGQLLSGYLRQLFSEG